MPSKEAAMLVLCETEGQPQEWQLDQPEMLIGRGSTAAIRLNDRQVSREHARIRRVEGSYVVEDLGSKNGTFVNGEPLIAPRTLQDGDDLQIALGFRLLFVDSEATAPIRLVRERVPGLLLDPDSRRVWVESEELDPPLSAAQYRLLYLLYENAGKVCSRDSIVSTVWPGAMKEGVTEQAVDALVRRLRDRLAQHSDREFITTVRGHGFRLEAGPSW
ncbi:MAG: FHA domain-containing protein [Chloroflexi bacterium]|nr:FHA domain-containing protein [Chloroflexota bacterium]MBU1750708.1 FHA domain-containing protein [Chloroflexota bacterium]